MLTYHRHIMCKSSSVLGKCLFLILLLGSLQSLASFNDTDLPDGKNQPSLFSNPENISALHHTADSIYDLVGLTYYGLERNVFYNAYKGFEYLKSKGKIKKKNLLTICDYSQSSNNKRLYVIDLEAGFLLYNTFVSHGKNSGEEYATSFSNLGESNQSSLGFLVTAETYSGIAGISMRFNGMEKGFNDNVRQRNIVMHGSMFVNESTIRQKGVIGNSLGCPAVPYGTHTRIINLIKDGSCFFVYHPNDWYARTSKILNAQFELVITPEALGAPAVPAE
jgi:hypothetical protein